MEFNDKSLTKLFGNSIVGFKYALKFSPCFLRLVNNRNFTGKKLSKISKDKFHSTYVLLSINRISLLSFSKQELLFPYTIL